MPRQEDFIKEFVLFRAQFLTDDRALWPTSKNLGNLTAYMHTVLEDSVLHLRPQAVPRKWVITHPRVFHTLRSTMLIGTLGYIKNKPRNVFDFERAEFKTKNDDDAELLRFIFDGAREILAIQRSTFPQETIAEKFVSVFRLASPEVRHNRTLALYPIPVEDDAVAAIEGETVRRFVVKIRRPNADLHGVFKNLFDGNDSDEVDLMWWNRREQLKLQVTGLFEKAIEAVRSGFGEWTAYVRVGKRLKTVHSSNDAYTAHFNTETDEALAMNAEATFSEVPELSQGISERHFYLAEAPEVPNKKPLALEGHSENENPE